MLNAAATCSWLVQNSCIFPSVEVALSSFSFFLLNYNINTKICVNHKDPMDDFSQIKLIHVVISQVKTRFPKPQNHMLISSSSKNIHCPVLVLLFIKSKKKMESCSMYFFVAGLFHSILCLRYLQALMHVFRVYLSSLLYKIPQD